MAIKEFYVDYIEDGLSKEAAVELMVDDGEWNVSVIQLFAMKFDVDEHTLTYLVDECFIDISILEEQVEDELQEKYSRDARDKFFCEQWSSEEE